MCINYINDTKEIFYSHSNLLVFLKVTISFGPNIFLELILKGLLVTRQVFRLMQGNEMHIRQGNLFIEDGEELSFYEILLRARQRTEIVIGYRLGNVEKAVINPSGKMEKRRWSMKDVFVVIAETFE